VCGAREIEGYYACLFEESNCPNPLVCSTTTTPAPVAAPASTPEPTAEILCREELTSYAQCFTSQEPALSCIECVSDVLPEESGSCSDAEDLLCAAIPTCGCGVCGAREIETYYACLFEESDCPTALDCSEPTRAPVMAPTVNPTSPPVLPVVEAPTKSPSLKAPTVCRTQEQGLEECYSTGLSPDASQSCTNCVDSFRVEMESPCEDLEDKICSDLDSESGECQCDPCREAVMSLFTCLMAPRNCSLECSDSEANPFTATSSAHSTFGFGSTVAFGLFLLLNNVLHWH